MTSETPQERVEACANSQKFRTFRPSSATAQKLDALITKKGGMTKDSRGSNPFEHTRVDKSANESENKHELATL